MPCRRVDLDAHHAMTHLLERGERLAVAAADVADVHRLVVGGAESQGVVGPLALIGSPGDVLADALEE
jgi:hypothetical protein